MTLTLIAAHKAGRRGYHVEIDPVLRRSHCSKMGRIRKR